LLRYGNGIAQDILAATHWFIQAAKHQDVVAMGNLSSIIGELELIADADNRKAQQYLKAIKAFLNEKPAERKQPIAKKQDKPSPNAQFDF
jgi:TPR repeat protein